MGDDRKYWAALPPTELMAACEERRANWLDTVFGGGRQADILGRSAKMLAYYYGIARSGNSYELTGFGEQGSTKTVYVNLLRYLIDYTHSLVTSPPVAYSADPLNSDTESYDSVLYSQAILDYVVDEKELQAACKEMALWSFLTSEGFVLFPWDPNAGDDVAVSEDGAEKATAGDIAVEVMGPLSVARERLYAKRNDTWFIVTRHLNKYDLAAEYPAAAEQIISAKPEFRHHMLDLLGVSNGIYADEMVPVHTLWHAKTPALPSGVEFVYVQDGPVLSWTGLPYSRPPIVQMKAGKVLGTDVGYSNGFDLLALQDAYNGILSNVITNYIKFGLAKFQVPSTTNIQPEDFAGTNKLIRTNGNDEVKPTPFPGHNQEMLQMAGAIQALSTQMMGQNDASLGQISSSSRLSGDVVSTMMQQSLQYMSGPQEAYMKAVRKAGDVILEVYRDRAEYPRVLRIVGKNRARFVEDFVGTSMLSGVDRVQVKLSQADAVPKPVRASYAAQFLQYGLLKSVEEHAQYMLSGKIDHQIEIPAEIMNSIKRENEMLRNGEKPEVILVEDHIMHIRGHVADILANPDAKTNAQVMEATLAHIMSHVEFHTQVPPDIAFMFGHTPGMPPDPNAMPADAAQPDMAMAPAPEEAAPDAAAPAEQAPDSPVITQEG